MVFRNYLHECSIKRLFDCSGNGCWTPSSRHGNDDVRRHITADSARLRHVLRRHSPPCHGHCCCCCCCWLCCGVCPHHVTCCSVVRASSCQSQTPTQVADWRTSYRSVKMLFVCSHRLQPNANFTWTETAEFSVNKSIYFNSRQVPTKNMITVLK